MDAVKFLKEKTRMCNSVNCCECPLDIENNGKRVNCQVIERDYTEEAVSIVEKWSKDHPFETRQSKFLKAYPSADVTDGVLFICPRRVDLNCLSEKECRKIICPECMKKYWLSKEE